METPNAPKSLNLRIREGLERIATAIRADDWVRARTAKLNPAQFAIIETLEGRPSGMSVKELARQLGVSQPSVTDSVAALERKGFVERRSLSVDRRSVNLVITASGQAALNSGQSAPSIAEQAAAALDTEEQEDLLVLLIAMIRQLQEIGAIPIQRMCVSCRHFRPFAHADAAQPHHCTFVDAAFGQQDLRIDCREHETADPSFRAATWNVFTKDHPRPPGK